MMLPIITITILGIFFISIILIKQNSVENNKCFVEIGKEFCEEQGKEFMRNNWNFGYQFICGETSRSFNGALYKFTREEVERCLGKSLIDEEAKN